VATTREPAVTSELQRALAPPLGEREVRAYELTGIEFREPGEDTGGNYYTLSGHAAVFNVLSLPLYDWWFGEYREKIAPGFFSNVLGTDPDVHLVYVHDMASAMARTRSKTLQLREDEIGLRVWAQLDPEDLDVQRIAPKMRRGDVDQMSFAFAVAAEEWLVEEEGETIIVTRTLLECEELYDTSVVPQGAYPQTDVGLRRREFRGLVEAAVESGRLALPEAAEELRRAGVSPAGAETVAPVPSPAGGPSLRARRLRQMRQRAAIAQTYLPKEQ